MNEFPEIAVHGNVRAGVEPALDSFGFLSASVCVMSPISERCQLSVLPIEHTSHATHRLLAQRAKPDGWAWIRTTHIICSERFWHYICFIFTNTPFPKMTTSIIAFTLFATIHLDSINHLAFTQESLVLQICTLPQIIRF